MMPFANAGIGVSPSGLVFNASDSKEIMIFNTENHYSNYSIHIKQNGNWLSAEANRITLQPLESRKISIKAAPEQALSREAMIYINSEDNSGINQGIGVRAFLNSSISLNRNQDFRPVIIFDLGLIGLLLAVIRFL